MATRCPRVESSGRDLPLHAVVQAKTQYLNIRGPPLFAVKELDMILTMSIFRSSRHPRHRLIYEQQIQGVGF